MTQLDVIAHAAVALAPDQRVASPTDRALPEELCSRQWRSLSKPRPCQVWLAAPALRQGQVNPLVL